MTTTAATIQIVTFRLGDDLFAAEIHAVERVLRYREPTSIPDVPDWIAGVVEYEGRVVPVIDLRRRFSLPSAALPAEARLIVLASGGDWVAATVDGVLDVRAVEAAGIAPPPPLVRGLAAEFLHGLVKRDDRLVLLLDIAHLLSATDRLALERAVDAPPGSA
jgi:purine-binding chemotaxis protein CheW